MKIIKREDIEQVLSKSEIFYTAGNFFDNESVELMKEELIEKLEELFNGI